MLYTGKETDQVINLHLYKPRDVFLLDQNILLART